MNETLEAMARAIFKSWFVDFDPVKAKAEGRQPYGMDAETAALFPDSFEDSELGPIPKGWSISTIDDLCDFVSRGVTPKYFVGSKRYIINQKVNRGTNLDHSNLKELHPDLEVPPEKYAHKWDVLINCLGEGTLGRVHFYTGENSIFAVDQHMSICRAKDPAIDLYIYLLLSSDGGQHKIQASKTGSTGMTMFNISKLRTFSLIKPKHVILKKLEATCLPLFQLKNELSEEITYLAQLRDTLLPKLISGEREVLELSEKV